MHRLGNETAQAVRLPCLCMPAGQNEFFHEIGTPAPKLSPEERKAFMEKSQALAPKFKTELLKSAD